MHVVTYVRVSTEEQHAPNKVSITEQTESIRAYVAAHGWQVVAEYSDVSNYIAAGPPNRGKPVNPSATRTDRPGFVALLDHLRTGQVDAVVCYRDDRLYRHERVVTALMDAVDEADRIRKAPVEIHQATGKIERDFMYLQAMIWRKENEARVARTVLGKVGTLKAGYWPGAYNRLGYKTEPGPRGNRIVIDDPAAATVKAIFTWYDSGRGLTDISRLLIAAGHYQPPGNKPRRVDWSVSVLYTILVARDYTGVATYNFRTGAISIDIPQIISQEQFDRVQARLKSTNAFSPRRTKHHHYLLSGLGVCGFCGRRLYGRTELYFYGRRADGTKVKYYHHKPRIYYRCPGSARSGNSDCPGLRIPNALEFEWQVWRWVVDNVINNDAFFEQAGQIRQAEQQQADTDHDRQLDRLRQYLAGLEQRRAATRARYARGGLSESDLDAILAEIDLATLETRAEIAGLVAARDTARAAAAGAESMRAMIAGWRELLAEIDVAPGDMVGLSETDREDIYRARQEVVRAVAVAVRVWGVDRFEVEVAGW